MGGFVLYKLSETNCVKFIKYYILKIISKMSRELTERSYKRYITTIKRVIIETEKKVESLNKNKWISELSYEDWVKFQNGELKYE